ncbi:MAG: hypothetical protein KBT31_03775 [Firmicutes bacterium]|nr:hypothetical protein [Candidatus Colimorpha enterica]
MKKTNIITALLLAALILVLSSCVGNGKDPSDETSATAETTSCDTITDPDETSASEDTSAGTVSSDTTIGEIVLPEIII